MEENMVAKVLTKTHVFDIQFCPSEDKNCNLIGASTIDGCIQFYDRDQTSGKFVKKLNLQTHKKSCRTFRFLPNASQIVSGSLDGRCILSNLDSESEAVWKSAKHPSGVNCLFVLNENVFASGDDDGNIFLWDIRAAKEAISFDNKYTEPIFDMAATSDLNYLYVTSGDKLQQFEVRKNFRIRNKKVSDEQDEDLYALSLVHHEKKVVCGSSEGVLSFFSCEDISDLNDRIDLKSNVSIHSIAKYDDKTLLLGLSDGIVQIARIFPNYIAGILCQHGDDEDAIEKITLNSSLSLLASCSHDGVIRFFSTDGIEEVQKTNKKKRKKNDTVDLRSKDFFSDLTA